MILYLSFEELAALNTSASDMLAADPADGHGVAAPPQVIAEIELLLPQLDGDIGVASLDEQRRIQRTLRHVLLHARRMLDRAVLEQHPAAESAVAAYFIYAHVLTVSRRVEVLGDEMAALIRLLTDEHPDSDNGRQFSFPD